MYCDFKNCRLWANNECTDEEVREKCPLMEDRLNLRAADDAICRLKRELERAYQLIGELTE